MSGGMKLNIKLNYSYCASYIDAIDALTRVIIRLVAGRIDYISHSRFAFMFFRWSNITDTACQSTVTETVLYHFPREHFHID